jgi:hypothetical protein
MNIPVLPFSFIFLVFVFGCHMQKLAFKETLYTTSLSRAMKFGREKKKRDW